MWLLVIMCCTPFLVGVIGTLVAVGRVGQLGWWGLIPFGGTFKAWWMEKKG